jgi:tetratricopeptide (TPR) repeat protein
MPAQHAGAAADQWQLYQDQGTRAYSQGRSAEAEQLFCKAISEAQKARPADARLADSLASLAAVYQDARRYEESERLYRQAVGIYERPELGTNRPDRAQCLEGFAKLLRQTERGEAALQMESAARSIWERLWANATYEGVIAEDNADLGGAERAFRTALEYSEHFPHQSGRMLGTLENLVALLDKQGRSAEAEPLCKDALSICEKVFGPDHKKTTRCRKLYERLEQKNHASGPAPESAIHRSTEPPTQ